MQLVLSVHIILEQQSVTVDSLIFASLLLCELHVKIERHMWHLQSNRERQIYPNHELEGLKKIRDL